MSIKNPAEEAVYINIKTENGRLLEPIQIINGSGRIYLITATDVSKQRTEIKQWDDVPTDEDIKNRQTVIDALTAHPSTFNVSTH